MPKKTQFQCPCLKCYEIERSASTRQCLGCGMRLPAWISDEYGSLTPRIERICDFGTLATAG
jgi:hypothetical protein